MIGFWSSAKEWSNLLSIVKSLVKLFLVRKPIVGQHNRLACLIKIK